ncbi:hypothetical protein BGW42_000158 [Actinomortierella wolfii]|nr:hypothetical protein BGW42_000158 [Actinomortierella wolfii]
MNGRVGHRPSENGLDWRYFSAENYATSSAASASEADHEADIETEGLDFEYDDETQPSESNEPYAQPQSRQAKLPRTRGAPSINDNNNSNNSNGQESRRSRSTVAASPKASSGLFAYTSAKEADESTDTIKNLRARALDRMNQRGSTAIDGENGVGLNRNPSSSLNGSPRISKTSDDASRGLRRISDNERSSLTRQSSFRTSQQSQQQSQGGPRLLRYNSHHQTLSQDQDNNIQQRSSGSLARYSQNQGLGITSEEDSQSESTLTRANAGSLVMEKSRRVMMDELKSLKARVEELEMERMSRSLSLSSVQQPMSPSRPQASDLRAAQSAQDRALREREQYNHEKHQSLPMRGDQGAPSAPAASLSRQSSLRKDHMVRPASRPSSMAGSTAFASTQHVELLKDAFDFFEKTVNHSVELIPSDHAVPSVQGMARIVSHALSMNETIRTWVKADVSLVESSSMHTLLRASDDQIRSLTESLLSTANLIAELEQRSAALAPPATTPVTIREPYVTPSSPLPRSSSGSVISRSPRGSITTSSVYRSASLAGGHSSTSLGGYTSAGEDRAQGGRLRSVRQTWHPSGYESAGSISSFGQAASAVASIGNVQHIRTNSAARISALQEPLRHGYTSDFSHERNGSYMSSGSSAMARSETLPMRREAQVVVAGYDQHQNHHTAFRPQEEELEIIEQGPETYPQQQTTRTGSQRRGQERLSQIAQEKRYSGIEQRLSRVQSPTFADPNIPMTAEQLEQQQQASLDPVARRQANVRQLMAKYSAKSPTSIFFNPTANGSMADEGQQTTQMHDVTAERNMREIPGVSVNSIQERRNQREEQETVRNRIPDLHLAKPTLAERRAQMQQQRQQQQEQQQQAQYQHHQHKASMDMARPRLGGGRYASMTQSMMEMQNADMQMITPAISSASSSPSSSRADGQSVGSHRVLTPDNGSGNGGPVTITHTAAGGVSQQILSPRGKSAHHKQNQGQHMYKMDHSKAEMVALPQQPQQQHRLSNKATL